MRNQNLHIFKLYTNIVNKNDGLWIQFRFLDFNKVVIHNNGLDPMPEIMLNFISCLGFLTNYLKRIRFWEQPVFSECFVT